MFDPASLCVFLSFVVIVYTLLILRFKYRKVGDILQKDCSVPGIMDVTQKNFKTVLSDIKGAVSDASFLSIDCEFSGLTLSYDTNINPYDSYEQYYSKIKRNVNKFLMFQFGLCTFRYDSEEQVYKQKCYNFYVFPRPVNRNVPDFRFTCQTSSIDFLASHNFDFNKVFKEGITYINKEEEARLNNVLLEKQKNRANNAADNSGPDNVIPVPEEEKQFVQDTLKIIEDFLKTGEEEQLLPQCNAFRRRLIYQTGKEKFGTKINLETRVSENKDRMFYVQKPESSEKRMEKEQKRHELQLAEIQEAVGFSEVIQHISESGKMLVGHNLCLDLLHIIDKFLTPLPENYAEFKECAHDLFPRILDTKIMASSAEFKDLIDNSALPNVISAIKKKPFKMPQIEIEENAEGFSVDDDKLHNAGYDAFVTGLCFLTMAGYLDKPGNLHLNLKKGSFKFLKPYLNKLFVLKLQDCPYINLTGNDPKSSRDHVFHLTFPKEWKISEIVQLFSPFGNVHVTWLNYTSAYVALHRRDQAALAQSTLTQSDTYSIVSYADYQQSLKKSKGEERTPFSSPGIMRKRRESEPSSQDITKRKRRNTNSTGSTSGQKSESPVEAKEVSPASVVSKMTKLFDENSEWN